MDIEKIIAQVTEKVMSQLAGGDACEGAVPMDQVAGRLEHSLLNPDMTMEQIVNGCMEAKKYRFANVCVTPYLVPAAANCLQNSGIKVCAPVAFPHGAASTEAKLAEIKAMAAAGADELDISLNLVAVKSGRLDDARRDLDAMVKAAYGRVQLKAIYEQGLYTPEEKEKVLIMIKNSGVEFLKISNFLSGKKAAPEDAKYVRSIVGRGVGIKIDGGVKTLETAMSLFAAGADRIGLTAGVAIAQEAMKRK
ncbi:MAG: deoxyribose-phosphate aldolase [Christensenellaceae bacterium]|nr:deoxyribose-phosphate aldolase [Christensenellaceae bacterium]